MKKMIFHIPFAIDPDRPSASQIRPVKMIEAFRSIGFDVYVVDGHLKKRSKIICQLKRQIVGGEKFTFCYSESSTMPTLLTEKHHLPTKPFLDFGFFSFLKLHGIPIGLFYRDVHWRFEQYNLHAFIKYYTRFFYEYDLKKYLQYVSILFLPSQEMKRHLPELKDIKSFPLPPGLDPGVYPHSPNNVENEKIRILYVGGVGFLYDLRLFLRTVVKFKQKITFTVCCRQSEYEVLDEDYKDLLSAANVLVTHKSGAQLQELYSSADIGCLFVNPVDYWAFAMPMKLFEYVAYEKPVVAVTGTATSKFINERDIGWSFSFEEEALDNFFTELVSDRNSLSTKKYNMHRVKIQNTWQARASFVEKILKST